MSFIVYIKRIKPSRIVGINVKVNALRAEGKDVLVLLLVSLTLTHQPILEKLLLIQERDKQDMS